MDEGSISKEPAQDQSERPSPTDFERFLPWACMQLQMETVVQVTKVVQQEYVTVSNMSGRKLKSAVKKPQSDADVQSDEDKRVRSEFVQPVDRQIEVTAIFDTNDNLVHIKFDRNSTLPRKLFKVIGLIVPFYYYLTSITIKKGLNEYIVHELCSWLPLSNITDVCLDNAPWKTKGNYHLLLEKRSFIRYLSLSRCSIDDNAIEIIAGKLAHPLPASESLCILNLSTNYITDDGAKFLAEALRTNRRLVYLNLADNMISDNGALCLLDSLQVFPLSFSELILSRSRHLAFLQRKNELVTIKAKELQANDIDKRILKKKSLKATVSKKGKSVDGDVSLRSDAEQNKSQDFGNIDPFLDKAKALVDNLIGEFKDPLNKTNTFVKDGITYCAGNDSLAYLNLSFNNLSYISIVKLLDVLSYQRRDKKPKGLVNVSIDGNFLPAACVELAVIDQLLDNGLDYYQRDAASKKRRLSKLRP